MKHKFPECKGEGEVNVESYREPSKMDEQEKPVKPESKWLKFSKPHYTIVVAKSSSVEDICSQLRAIKIFPCVLSIYDRTFVVDTEDEAWMLIHGIEIGRYSGEE